jgi:hypothetical protein
MWLSRCGIDPYLFLEDDDFRGIYDFNTRRTVNLLGTATSAIAETGLREISSTVLNLQRAERNQSRTFAENPMGALTYQISKGALTMNAITYTEVNGYQIPDLTLPEESDEITELADGRYARKRREYLKNHRPGLFTDLLTTCTLNRHLAEIEQTARSRMELMLSQMAASQGVTEELKQHNQMRWVGLMNNLRHSAEETILAELIFN